MALKHKRKGHVHVHRDRCDSGYSYYYTPCLEVILDHQALQILFIYTYIDR